MFLLNNTDNETVNMSVEVKCAVLSEFHDEMSITLSSALSNGWKLLCDPVFVGDKRAQGANTWAGPHFLFVFQKENDPVHVAQSSEQ